MQPNGVSTKRRKPQRGASTQPRRLPSGILVYDVRYRERRAGATRHCSATFATAEEAEAFARSVANKRKQAQYARQDPSIMEQYRRPPGVIVDLLPEFISAKFAGSKLGSAHPRSTAYVLRHSLELMGWRSTTEVGAAELTKLMQHYAHKNASQVQYIGTWLNFLAWADAKKYAVDHSFHEIRRPAANSTPTYAFTYHEVERIMAELQRPLPASVHRKARRHTEEWANKLREINDAAMRQAFLPIFWIQVYWALRPYEACRLTIDNWHAETRTLTIPTAVAKNQKQRAFVVDAVTARMLDSLCRGRDRNDYLFLAARGGQYTPEMQTRYATRLLDRLGIRGTLYSARHHACSRWCVLLRGNIPDIQTITGHLSLSQLERYLHQLHDSGAAQLLNLDQVASGTAWSRPGDVDQAPVAQVATVRPLAADSTSCPVGAVALIAPETSSAGESPATNTLSARSELVCERRLTTLRPPKGPDHRNGYKLPWTRQDHGRIVRVAQLATEEERRHARQQRLIHGVAWVPKRAARIAIAKPRGNDASP